MKKILSIFFVSLVVLLSASGLLRAEEVKKETTYRNDIKPIFDAKCAVCHGADAPEHPVFKLEKEQWLAKMKGPRMDTYSTLIYHIGWPDTGAVMRRLDDGKNAKDGKPGNMYQYLGATEEERQKNLDIFKAWVGNWTLKKSPEATKEDLDKIKSNLKY